MNLISNGLKFTPRGGLIKVTAKKVESIEDLSIQEEVLESIVS